MSSSIMEEALKILGEEGFELPDDVISTLTSCSRSSKRRTDDRFASLPEGRHGSLRGQRFSDFEAKADKWTSIPTHVEGRSPPTTRHRSAHGDWESSTKTSGANRSIPSESGYDTSSSRTSDIGNRSKRYSFDTDLGYRVSFPPSESGWSTVEKPDYVSRQDSTSSTATDYSQADSRARREMFERGESTDSTSTASTVREVSGSNTARHDSFSSTGSGEPVTSFNSQFSQHTDSTCRPAAGGFSHDARVENMRNSNLDMANKAVEQLAQGSNNPIAAVPEMTSHESHSTGGASSMEARQNLKKETATGTETLLADKKYSEENRSDFSKTSKASQSGGLAENELSLAKKDSSKTFSSEKDSTSYCKKEDTGSSSGTCTTAKQDSGYYAADSQLNTTEITTADGKKLRRQESVSSVATSAAMAQAKVSDDTKVSKSVDKEGREIENVEKTHRQENCTSKTSSMSTSQVVQEDGLADGVSNKPIAAVLASQMTRQDSNTSTTSEMLSKTIKADNSDETRSETSFTSTTKTSSKKTEMKSSSSTSSTNSNEITEKNVNSHSNFASNSSSTGAKREEAPPQHLRDDGHTSSRFTPNTDTSHRVRGDAGLSDRYSSLDSGIDSTKPYQDVPRSGRLSSQSSNLSRQDSTTSSIDSSASAMYRRTANTRQPSLDDSVFDPASRRVSLDSVTKLKEAAKSQYARSNSDYTVPRKDVSADSTARKEHSTSHRSYAEDGDRYSSGRSKYDDETLVGNYSSKTLPSRHLGSRGYSSPYSKDQSRDDLHGISTKRVSQSSSNRRATLNDGVLLSEQEMYEARRDVRKVMSRDGDAYTTTKDSSRSATSYGKGTGDSFKTSRNEKITDAITKEFTSFRMDDDFMLDGFGSSRDRGNQRMLDDLSGYTTRHPSRQHSSDGFGVSHSKSGLHSSPGNRSTAYDGIGRHSTRSEILSEGFVTDDLRSDKGVHSKHDVTAEEISEKIRRQLHTADDKYARDLSGVAKASRAGTYTASHDASFRDGRSIDPSIPASRLATSATGEVFSNRLRDDPGSSGRRPDADRRPGDRIMKDGIGDLRGSLSPEVGSRFRKEEGGSLSGSVQGVRGGDSGSPSRRQEPPFPLKTDDNATVDQRRKRIDSALTWIRSELSVLRAQDKVLMSQFQRCQDSIEQLKKQRPWYDAFSDDDDDDRHWEDWEIEDFDRACQKEKREYFSKKEFDPKSGTITTVQKEKMDLHETEDL